MNHSVPADADVKAYQPRAYKQPVLPSAALSIAGRQPGGIRTRRIAILASDGLGWRLFDAIYVPGGAKSVASLTLEADALHFLREASKHYKTISAARKVARWSTARALHPPKAMTLPLQTPALFLIEKAGV